MKRIVIKSMRLLNFKGIRDLSVEFGESVTTISGRNGLGKSTIFDAFCWLLFDKNADDKKAFSIKTLDGEGVAIPRIPHEVSAVVEVDGKEMKISKSLKEKWVKQKGSAEEEFKGHDTQCMWDDVPMKVGDFNQRIAMEICEESVFKMLTSPNYFNALKTDQQRAVLFKIAGTLADEQIAGTNEEFARLLKDMDGKSLVDFKRAITAKKSAIKKEIDSLPARIDERKREKEPDMDEYTATHKHEIIKGQIEEIDKKLADFNEQMRDAEAKVTEHSKKIFDLKSKADKRRREIESELNKSYYEQTNRNNKAKADIESAKVLIQQNEERIARISEYVGTLNGGSEKLRDEYKRVFASQIEFNESDFVCPTCKRPFDFADIESKKAEMVANFNAEKASRLNAISAKGKENKALIEAKNVEIERLKEASGLWFQKIAELERSVVEAKRPDIESAIAEDNEIREIENEVKALQEQRVVATSKPVTVALSDERKELQMEANQYSYYVEWWNRYRDNLSRIEELEKMLAQQSQALADLEKTEFTMQEFSKARTTAMEESVNSMFTMVKFKMFERQINGGEVETCVAMVDGVPYPDANRAGQVNASLDIINAFVNAYEISAPIFCDNAESVNKFIDVSSQIILLKVSEDKELTINKN